MAARLPFVVWLDIPDFDLLTKIRADYLASASDQLYAAAKESKVDVVMGVVERDRYTRGTTYCTLLFISNEGQILGRHLTSK